MTSNMVPMHERIHRRSGHIAVAYKEYLLVWGGYMERLIEIPNNPFMHSEQEYHYVDEVWAYDSNTEIWERIITTGAIPSKVSGSCGVVLDHYLYVFGGYVNDDSFQGNSNRLYRLDLRTWVWQLLSPIGQSPSPCDKLVGWTYKDKLYFFGGFGPAPTYRASYCHVLAETVEGYDTRGWTNQLPVYNSRSNEWEWPKIGGTIPSPRAAHAADISGDKVFIFGGRFKQRRTNDLFCLNLTKMHWSDNLTENATSGLIPEGRSWHSFTVVSPDRAVLYGGFNNTNTVLSDCWMLYTVRLSWQRPVHLHLPVKGRHWHSTACINKQLLGIGAVFKTDHADEMLIIDFTPKSLLRLSMDAVLSTVPRKLWMGAPNGESCLPLTLEVLLRRRFEQANALPNLQCS